MATRGQNVWYDLMATDVESAKRFYTETIGWKTQQWQDGDPNNPYTMWVAGDAPIGGMMRLPEAAQKAGAPPHWVAYTTVEDVDKAVALIQKLGGRVHQPAFDVPKVGRMAIVADPQGAAFAVFTPEDGSWKPEEERPLQFSWAELNTTDWEGAWKFYSELFGWKERSKMDMGPMGTYFMFEHADGGTKGGMSNMAKQMNLPAHWLYYVTVSDIDAAIARVKQHGGKVLNGPMAIPGDDVIAQCADPQGAFFALYAKGKKS